MTDSAFALHLGVAGWSLPRAYWPAFPTPGTHLQRYAAVLPAVEINSAFYRPHRPATYAKWAASTPAAFRFAVKMPRQITHERRLVDCDARLDTFLAECTSLGGKLGCLLVQLPPSLAHDPADAGRFFTALRRRYGGFVVLEPRHASWREAAPLLHDLRIGQVAADPSPIPGGERPAGWPGIVYYRLHGSPRLYYSDYDRERLQALAGRLRTHLAQGTPCWCIFDNTAAGEATGDALQLKALLEAENHSRPD